MSTPWNRFKQAVELAEPDQVPVAFIVDSPWLPDYAGMNTLDFFLQIDNWFEVHRNLLVCFPDAVWIPGFWVEYGMATEPSAFGVRIHFHQDSPPSMEPTIKDVAHWASASAPNPETDGLMPLVLRRYQYVEERLAAEGLGVKMVAARGPVTIAGWLMGVTDLMMALVTHPAEIHQLLDTLTTTVIRWLHAQLETLHKPEGILLLDDLVGMVSLAHYNEFFALRLRRIFDEFGGLIRVYHNDTPCAHLYPALAEANFDVFNFTHKEDIGAVKKQMGHRVALMGNVPPLDVAVRETPEKVAECAKTCLDKAAPGGGMILSVGGGVSPGTPVENLEAMLDVACHWVKSN